MITYIALAAAMFPFSLMWLDFGLGITSSIKDKIFCALFPIGNLLYICNGIGTYFN